MSLTVRCRILAVHSFGGVQANGEIRHRTDTFSLFSKCAPWRGEMSTARVVAKATKVAWQRDVARLYYHMLCQLHLERRWIPIEELALAGEEFLSLFRARFVDRTFRCSMLDAGPDDIVFTTASYNCAGQDGVNVFARRFTRIPRAWVFADTCKSADPSPPAPTPVAPRLLLE